MRRGGVVPGADGKEEAPGAVEEEGVDEEEEADPRPPHAHGSYQERSLRARHRLLVEEEEDGGGEGDGKGARRGLEVVVQKSSLYSACLPTWAAGLG